MPRSALSLCRTAIGSLLIAYPLAAAPTATDDAFSVNEDDTLVVTKVPLIDSDFESGSSGGGTVAFDGNWDYFDQIENENGATHGYPVDGSGNAWNSVSFNPATSTIGTWQSGAMPLQAGTIQAFPGAPDVLAGIGAAGNGENLITTYLFRNTFTLTATQAATPSWTASLVADDGCIIYINGAEVDRLRLPAGAINTTTLCNATGDESNYEDRSLSLGGILQAGTNTICIEVHQVSPTSSDVGIDLSLSSGSTPTDNFVYQDDYFGTNLSGNSDGELDATGGFNGSAGLNVEVGFGLRFFSDGAKSGAWFRDIGLASPGTLNISFRYRLTTSGGFDSGDFAEAILDVDGTRYGNDQNNSLVHIDDGGDSGWQTASFNVPLSAGSHAMALGIYNNASRGSNEFANVWFDDVLVQFLGGTGGVLENDSGASPTAVLETTTSNGTLNLDSDGTFTYSPAQDFFGTDSFTYRAVDGTGTSNIATATITVSPVNDPPQSAPDSYPALEDVTLEVPESNGVLDNDSDVENQTLSATLVSQASNGTVTLDPDGSFSYAPNLDFFGIDTFTYRAGDGSAFSSAETVTITVSAGDDPPIANPDDYEADENTPLVITESGSGNVVFSTNFDTTLPPQLTGGGAPESAQNLASLGTAGNQFGGQVFRNATGVAGNGIQTPTVLTLTNLPAHTSLSIEFLLAILDTWNGIDSGTSDIFGVQLDGTTVFQHYFNQDPSRQSFAPAGGGGLSTGSDLGFGPDNDSAYDLSLEASLRDIPHSGTTATVSFFAGGSNWDGGTDESWAMDNLKVTVSSTPRQTILSKGSTWSYLDDGSDQGTAWRAPAFDATSWGSGPAELGYGDSDEATVLGFGGDGANKFVTYYFRSEFNVADPSVYSNLLLQIVHDDSAAVYLNGVEISRTNLIPNADSGEFAVGSIASELEAATFQHTIDPSLLVAGTNVIAVEVHQGTPGSSDLSFDLALDGIPSRAAGGVLANDIDVDGQTLTASLVTNAGNGNVSLNPDGTFTYTPGLNFHGTDSFVYAASDGAQSTNGTVTITVIPGPNSLPEPMPDTYPGTEDETLVVSAANGVLDNDDDPDLDPLTAALHTQASNGTVTLNADGSFTYVPTADFAGTDTFLYVANDTVDDSAPTLVTLNIANINDRPIANDDVFVAQPGQMLSIAAAGVLENDTDVDNGTTLSALLVDNVASGTLSLAGNGGFTYMPTASSGSVSFTYLANDTQIDSPTTATVTIHINGRPTAGTDSYPATEDKTLTVSASGVLGNDSDPENETLSAVLVTPPANGTLNLASDGGFTYEPDENSFGPDSFVYTANDGLQNSADTTVSITVAAVNDPPASSHDAYDLISGQTINIAALDGVLANDDDVDGPTLTASLLGTTSNGSLSLALDGSFTYTPNPAFIGTDIFTYVATDGTLNSDLTTVTLTVTPAAEAIVINEIMYHPASENNAEEYIELMNIGDASVDVTGWQFTNGISFTLPAITIPPREFLIVAADETTFTATYGAVPLLVGGWTGGLSNRGERVRLVDNLGNESDDVTYSDQGDWAQRQSVTDGGEQGWIWFAAHDGGGSSLELINPELSNKNGQNWAPSSVAPTPGAANTAAQSDIAPLISNVKHRPAVPRSTDSITITADLKDADGSTLTARLFRRASLASPGLFVSLPMFDDGLHGDGDANDGEFGVILPPAPDGRIYEFYIRADDGTNTRTWPAPTNTGQNANALFQIDDETFTGTHPIYRTVITQPDEDRFPFGNRQSNAELNATFIADNCGDVSVRYLCGMRIRGASSRNDTPPPTRLGIPTDNPWDGETRLNLNTQFTWLQFIGMKFFQASGLPAPDTRRVAMRRNGTDQTEQGEEGYGSLVHVQPLQEEFLDTHIPDDAGGSLYKKVRPDVDWAYRSGNVGDYLTDGWGKQTNASENDWSDLDEWLRVMNQAPGDADYIAQVEAVANLDQWMTWFAINTIINNGETNASNGADDDYSIYRGLVDTRFIFIPHDLDTILGQGDGSTITDPESTIFDMIERGDALAPLTPLFQDAGILTRYYTALREQLQTTFSVEQFDAFMDNHLSGWVPQQTITDMKNYMNLRRAYITGLVDAQLGAPPAPTLATTTPSLTLPHGDIYISEVLASNASAHSVSGLFPDIVELRNDGTIAVDIGGMTLTDTTTLPARYTFPPGTMIPGNGGFLVIDSNTLGFGFDAEGDSVYLFNSGGLSIADSISFGLQIPDLSIGRTGASNEIWTLTQPTIGATNTVQAQGNPDTLQINEWLVRPQVTFDRDFVELYNPDAFPVALSGLVITDEPVAIPQRHSMPALSFVGGSGFALLYPVGSGSYTPGNASELPFKLSADHGWLSISGTNGIEIDEVHYICQRNDVAFGRETDGSPAIVDFDLPTPGFSNGTDLTAEATILQSLRITEIMYHPSLGGDPEYIRLKNIGTQTINLNGIRMKNGITIDLPSVDLAPGEEAFIVRDQLLFESIYGSGGVLGQYSGGLSNGGERLRLEIASLEYGILDFDYSDSWYPATDGLGASLVIVDDGAERNTWGDKESWMAVGPDNSSYGSWASGHFTTDNLAIIARDADPEKDGITNAMEYALGLDPNVPDAPGLPTGLIENGFLTMTYTRNKNANVQWIVEVSGDLITWDSGPTFATDSMQSDDGTLEIWKAIDSVPVSTSDERFMRLKVIVP